MKVSAIASRLYQAAKVKVIADWNWKLEWSKAMKKAWREVMRVNTCGQEIWNSAASLHTRGIAGLKKIIQTEGRRIGATHGQEVMDHLYNDFLTRKESGRTEGKNASYYTFGFYLNLWHEKNK